MNWLYSFTQLIGGEEDIESKIRKIDEVNDTAADNQQKGNFPLQNIKIEEQGSVSMSPRDLLCDIGEGSVRQENQREEFLGKEAKDKKIFKRKRELRDKDFDTFLLSANSMFRDRHLDQSVSDHCEHQDFLGEKQITRDFHLPLTVSLLPHQQAALSWMCWREDDKCQVSDCALYSAAL
jgi:hypothetical protein